jgi:glucose uptake protein
VGVFYAFVTVLAWGTWLAPSQRVVLGHQQIKTFYVASANLLLASLVAASQGFSPFTVRDFGLPFIGGLIWSVSGLCAFVAAKELGMAKAFGLWAPLNILVSLLCGWVIFGEFRNLTSTSQLLLFSAVGAILLGVVLIILAKGTGSRMAQSPRLIGWLGALGAGVLWGIYFIPIKLSGVSLWAAAFPLAIGIFAGSTTLLLLVRHSPRLARRADYLRVGATGVLWTIGNYGMLLLVDYYGAGKGYTIAQLSVVVNALVGIYWLAEPPRGSRAAWLTLLGCVLATIGGILLGQVR